MTGDIAVVNDALLGTVNPDTSLTVAFDCGAGVNYLAVAVVSIFGNPPADNITGVTYNGVAMTRLKAVFPSFNSRASYLYGLDAPASGSQNIVISSNTSTYILGFALSLSNVKQGAQPDASTSAASASATSLTATVTSLADRCMGIMLASASFGPVAGAGTTLVTFDTLNAASGTYRSTTPFTPAGSNALNVTQSPAAGMFSVMVSLSPVPNTNITPRTAVRIG